MAGTRSYHSKSFSEDSGMHSHLSAPLSRTRSVAGPRPLPSRPTGHISQQYRNYNEPSGSQVPEPIIYKVHDQPFPTIISPKPQKFLPAVIETQYQDAEEYQVSGIQSWNNGGKERLFTNVPQNHILENNYVNPSQHIQQFHYDQNVNITNSSYAQDQGYPIQELIKDMQEITIQRNLPEHTNRAVLPSVPIPESQTQYQRQQFNQDGSGSWGSPSQLTSGYDERQYIQGPGYLDRMSDYSRHSSLGPDGVPIPFSLSGGNRGSLYYSEGNRTPTPDRNSKIPPLKLWIDDKAARRRTAMSKTLALDENEALQKYREAAKKTNDPAIQMDYAKFLMQMVELGELGEFGEYGSTDVSKGSSINKLNEEVMYWVNQLAKNNFAEALYIKGTWFEYGTYGKEKNEEKAFKLYLSSSKQGLPKAKRKVAEYYEKNKDYKRALQFHKKAASLGDIVSINRLALVYMHGELKQEPDFKQALIYLKQAASKADEECPDGAYVYGMILAREYDKVNIPDDLVVPDDYEAKELILKAANLGHAGALFKMGSCYEYSALGCQFDPLLSIQYYKRATEKGYVEADMALSKWYLCGCEGYFEQNEELAYEYAEKAAMKGLPTAEFAMGYYHEVGIHVPANMSVANAWYTKAAEHGNKDAIDKLSKGEQFTRSDHELSKLTQLNEREQKGKDCVIQ
ncbi:9384_t:CDS:2 [Acaulospora morrowiae]|uniref:9384_t:CDS:1 n=1 Tax=Acaulospora morrowiae TaxID=94023 RepID=A0A9N8ZJB8_9GLOM|nr:9384_t:CDS:2 [Acaulospora morrowiae]